MSLMQIDSPSRPTSSFILPSHSSLANQLSRGMKRSISPSESSERPTKRVFSETLLATSPTYHQSDFPHAHPPHEQQHLNTARLQLLLERGISDDWVSKTDRLRLDSPGLYPASVSPFATQQQQQQVQGWNTPSGHVTPMNEHEHAQDVDAHEPMMTDTEPSHLSVPPWSSPHHNPQGSPQPVPPPPTTPTHDPISIATPPESDSDMLIHSPNRLSTSGLIQPIPRKQRVTMGPRQDCEKCRTGVPGHWMHFD